MAEQSTANQRHGCVVVKNGNIWSLGHNVNVNHPTVLAEEHIKSGASIHAEMRALNVISNPKGVTVYVARINPKGEVMYSHPCTNCEAQLRELGVKRVVHT